MVIFYVYIHVYILVSDRPLSIKLTPPKGIMIETPDNMYIYIYITTAVIIFSNLTSIIQLSTSTTPFLL